MLTGTYWMLVQARVGTLYTGDLFNQPLPRGDCYPGSWSWRYWKLLDETKGFRGELT